MKPGDLIRISELQCIIAQLKTKLIAVDDLGLSFRIGNTIKILQRTIIHIMERN